MDSARSALHHTVAARALVLLSAIAAACGGAGPPPEQTLAELRAAIEAPVSSNEASQERSRTLQRLLETEVLMDMNRAEVDEAIGRGDPCSRHPRCAEQGFEGDDYFYTVGTEGDGAVGTLPLLIVGFDRTGRVTRLWSFRTH